MVVYRDTVQSHQPWRPRFSESCGSVNIPEQDPSLALVLGQQRGSMSRSRRQSAGAGVDVGVAVCREGYGGASGRAMTGSGTFTVSPVFTVLSEDTQSATGFLPRDASDLRKDCREPPAELTTQAVCHWVLRCSRTISEDGLCVCVAQADFLFEAGAADGALVGIVRSDYDLLEDHLSRGGVPVLPVASPEGCGWGFHLGDGALWHRGSRTHRWMGTSHWAADPHLKRDQGAETGDRIRLTLDLDRGSLALHNNDARLGLLVAGGLREDIEDSAVGYCWMVQLGSAGQAVRIAAPAGLAVRTGSGSPNRSLLQLGP